MRFAILCSSLMITMAMLASDVAGQPKPKDPPKVKEPEKEGSFERWPKEVAGKKLEEWVRDMKDSKDASLRELAIRTVPLFGPTARKAASNNLLYAINQDEDLSVRMAAISVVPVLGFDDSQMEAGINSLIDFLKRTNISAHVRYELTMALGNCGPLAKRAIPTVIQVSLLDRTSWQNRKAAAYAIGRLGMYIPPPMPKTDKAPKMTELPPSSPDVQAIRGLITALRDPSHGVRREAIASLMLLGPPDNEAAWRELREALSFRFKDTDRSVALWARVLFIQSDITPLKATDPNLAAIEKYLDEKDPSLRLEGIQAIGTLGDAAKSRLPRLIAIAVAKDEEPAIIATAIWAMSAMPTETPRILPTLQALKTHKDETIKKAAEAAIEQLTKKPDEPKKGKK